MNKKIVISVNANPDYLFYLPLTVWAWRKFGWEPIVLFHGNVSEEIQKLVFADLDCEIKVIPTVEGYRSDTLTQVSRLYAALFCDENDIIMTGDVDMIPLSDYWHPQADRITIYGHDLTGYGNYPICYIAMTRDNWLSVMNLDRSEDKALCYQYFHSFMQRDLNAFPQSKSTDFYQYWETDQDMVTARIKGSLIQKEYIKRGQRPNGYAMGRVDRGSWTLEHDNLIDCHMHRDVFKAHWEHKERDTYLKKYADTMRLLLRQWPNEDWKWLERYTCEYADAVNPNVIH